MKKSVLRTAIVIIVMMLFAEYILKLFIPEEFVLIINNPNLIKVGTYINNNIFIHNKLPPHHKGQDRKHKDFLRLLA